MTELHNSTVELELRRIARLTGVDAAALEGLGNIGVEDLQILRGQIASRLFDEHTDAWERAVAVTAVIPAGLSAKLSQAALGPVLSARVTPLAPTSKAIDIGTKLSPEFMADVAVNLDPRRINALIVAMPASTIAAVAKVLADRQEWLVMADFVAGISEPSLRTTLKGLNAPAILQISVLIENHDRTDQIVALLDDHRLDELREAATAEGLQAHLAHIADSVSDEQHARITA